MTISDISYKHHEIQLIKISLNSHSPQKIHFIENNAMKDSIVQQL